MTDDKVQKCSFCGREGSQLGDEKVIKGSDGIGICGTCVSLCINLIGEHNIQQKDSAFEWKIPKPSEIKSHLDVYTVGQDQAKSILAVAVCDHYKRIAHNSQIHKDEDHVRLEKSNILLIGPTGTGKTQLARAIATFLGVPFAIGDATSLTEAGYVGDDVENLLLRLIQAANGDIEKAQNGIIFVDELDKIASTGSNRSTSKDVGGEGVQQALLKMLEGTISHVSAKGGRKHPEGNVLEFDTTDVLFIGSGAFVGLDEIVNSRLEGSSRLGFQIGEEESPFKLKSKFVEPEDLIHFGLIPELVGRFSVIAQLQELSKEALRKIFVEVKNSLLQQFILQFKYDGVELEITEAAIEEIVSEAMSLKTGARGLRTIAEKVIVPYKYRIDQFIESGKCVIEGRLIEGNFMIEDLESEVG